MKILKCLLDRIGILETRAQKEGIIVEDLIQEKDIKEKIINPFTVSQHGNIYILFNS